MPLPALARRLSAVDDTDDGEAEEAVVLVGSVALPIFHITSLVLMRVSLPKPKYTPKMNGEISHMLNSNKFTGRKSKPGGWTATHLPLGFALIKKEE